MINMSSCFLTNSLTFGFDGIKIPKRARGAANNHEVVSSIFSSQSVNNLIKYPDNIHINPLSEPSGKLSNSFIKIKKTILMERKSIQTILWNPIFAWGNFWTLILILFLYLYLDDKSGELFEFGPDKTRPAKFLDLEISSWWSWFLVIWFSFFLGFIHSYLGTVRYHGLDRIIQQNTLNIMPKMSKHWAKLMMVTKPIGGKLIWILQILMLTNLKKPPGENGEPSGTPELQYILPNLIGYMMWDIPYDFYKIDLKYK
mgnify:CR=1 FL=1